MVILNALLAQDYLEDDCRWRGGVGEAGGGGGGRQPALATNVQSKTAYLSLLANTTERFTYHRMEAILILFLVIVMYFTPFKAGIILHIFGIVYALEPIFGSLLVDALVGHLVITIAGTVLLCIGQLALLGVLFTTDPWSRAILAVTDYVIVFLGGGGICSKTSCLIGNQFTAQMANMFKLFSRMVFGAACMCTLFYTATSLQFAGETNHGVVSIWNVSWQYGLLAADKLTFMLGASEYATSFSTAETKPVVHLLWLLFAMTLGSRS